LTPEQESLTAAQKENLRFAREGVLELTHNHGTETDAEFKGYANGNTEPGKGDYHYHFSLES
jgi:lactoylglutathione lyase